MFTCFACISNSVAQQQAYYFHKLSTKQGLSGGLTRDIGEDKYGFIWIASVGGLSRFDGRNVTTFSYDAKDTSSPLNSQPRCFYSTTNGRFFIGFETGLVEYDFKAMHFKRIPSTSNLFIQKIVEHSQNELLLIARSGLFKYNIKTGTIFNYSKSTLKNYSAIQNKGIQDVCRIRDNIYFATRNGLVFFDIQNDIFYSFDNSLLSTEPIHTLCSGDKGYIWISSQKYLLGRINIATKNFENYSNYCLTKTQHNKYTIASIQSDLNNNIWLATEGSGILFFDVNKLNVSAFTNNPLNNASPSVNTFETIFKSKKGMLWFGSDIDEINYLNPLQSKFSTLYPFPYNELGSKNKMGRAVSIDQLGTIWMGNHDGLSQYNPSTQQYTVFRNKPNTQPILYSNTIRSICCDHNNNIWIGTDRGVNKMNRTTGRVEFISPENLPLSFYNSINEDKSGNIWFCTTDSASLYWYNFKENAFHSITTHPELKKYAGYSTSSYVFEDSKQRLWISFTRKGLLMLNKVNGTLTHFKAKEGNVDSLIGNIVVDIKEDNSGNIWASTFSGVTCIHADNKTITNYTKQNGLGGNMCSGIIVDNKNRVWIGANGGLTMIDSTRKRILTYSIADGLNSVGFPEHAAIINEHQILFPSYNGYLIFDENQILETVTNFPFYVSSYSVADSRLNQLSEDNSVLSLKAYQNSFSFHLVGLNYNNPDKTWFAYKLDGFENEWHYTTDPKASYTNVQGGRYTFLYKALGNNSQWNSVNEKSISVHLQTFFYKTWWFRLFVLFVFLGLIYWLFRYRTIQQKKVFELVEKTQSLEKEKAMAMYENLKQQLNPHFLFNSLTSLNSLIEIEPQKASEFLESLSKTYRYILKSRDSELVPLGDEVKFAETYVQLQKTRFEQGLEVIINIPTDDYSYKIAPVTIQNLLENAIKHNIIDEATPLTIKIYTFDDTLIVENNLQKKNFVESSNKQGLAQMQNLYQHLSIKPLQIEETEKTFTVIIPLI